jgi:HK97 family phage prohead protease
VKDSDGSIAGCHKTKEDAVKQLAALYANAEGEAMSGSQLIHREDGRLEVRSSLEGWEVRHSGRPNELFTVRGYAAVFNQLSLDLGGFREQIDPAAFDDVLATNPDVHFVWDHDTRYVGARTSNGTLTLRTDGIGLLMDAQVGPYSWAKDLRTALERRDIDQGSFSFIVADDGDDWEVDAEEKVLRTIRKVSGLYDVTVTAKGAYPQTSMAVVRSLIAAATAEGRLPEAGAALVAEGGEQPSQKGGLDAETRKKAEELQRLAAVRRDEIDALIERAQKI